MSKRILSLVALVLGVLGAVGCITVVVVSWSFASRLTHATEIVFDGFENAFSAAQQQVARAGERVDTLKLNAESINGSLKNWGEKEVAARLNSQLGIKERVGRLESGLNQTIQWLEVIESSVQVVQQTTESGRTLGIPIRTDGLGSLLEEVAAVRFALSEVAAPVGRISEQARQLGEEETGTDRVGQIASVTTRLIATFGSIDTRLDSLNENLRKADAAVRETRTTVLSWIRLATAGMTLLACWMAAGQASLIYLGTKGLKQPQTPNDQ